MLQEFITQDYLIVEQNVVVNNVLWNGDTTQWTPPQGSIALIQANIPAMVWQAILENNVIVDWELVEKIGFGNIGFTWDGTVLTTNQPQPTPPKQPVTTGTVKA
mgnify:CR=1 FL=1